MSVISRAERRRRKFMIRRKHHEFLHCVLKWDISDLVWAARSRQSGDTHPLANDMEHCRYWMLCVEYKTKKREQQADDQSDS